MDTSRCWYIAEADFRNFWSCPRLDLILQVIVVEEADSVSLLLPVYANLVFTIMICDSLYDNLAMGFFL